MLEEILGVARPLIPPGQCTLTCLGADLLYEGMKLEIDATAVLGDTARRLGHDFTDDACASGDLRAHAASTI